MTITIEAQPQVWMLALEQIRHDATVRELASEDVEALVASISLSRRSLRATSRRPKDGRTPTRCSP